MLQLGRNQKNFDIYWCHHFSKGYYREIWLVSSLYILISLGLIFIRYPQMATIITVFQQSRSQGTNMKDAFITSWNQKATDLSVIGGLSFNVYILHSSLLTGIYFLAKNIIIL